jgi:tetratricopeptide (TPR) repeat protein
VALLNQNEAKEALDALRQGLVHFPTSFRLVYLTAMAEARLKHYDRAFQAFRKAEALAGANANELLNERFYFQVGAILGQAGREEESVEYLEKAIALDPEFDEALNHLGYTWAEKGKNLDRALDLIERAVKKDPENPAYLDSLGWVLFKLGRTSESLPHLERAAALLTEPDGTVYDHLGDVLAALGRMADAKEAWRKSVAIEKSDAVQRKLDGTP